MPLPRRLDCEAGTASTVPSSLLRREWVLPVDHKSDRQRPPCPHLGGSRCRVRGASRGLLAEVLEEQFFGESENARHLRATYLCPLRVKRTVPEREIRLGYADLGPL